MSFTLEDEGEIFFQNVEARSLREATSHSGKP
jgi:hypothetical protein